MAIFNICSYCKYIIEDHEDTYSKNGLYYHFKCVEPKVCKICDKYIISDDDKVRDESSEDPTDEIHYICWYDNIFTKRDQKKISKGQCAECKNPIYDEYLVEDIDQFDLKRKYHKKCWNNFCGICGKPVLTHQSKIFKKRQTDEPFFYLSRKDAEDAKERRNRLDAKAYHKYCYKNYKKADCNIL